jgi:trans-2,3-dihydro-3-hydroxyanthranilate isomerase
MTPAFVIADVFTRTPFGGNQLAVFPDAAGLTAAQMQALAREFNFAESTFVLPARDPRCVAEVRIFTPRSEMPFAGHPTVGTAAVLAAAGRLPMEDGRAAVWLQEQVGPVAVEVRMEGQTVFARLTLETGVEVPAIVPDRADVAAALSLPEAAIRDTWFAGIGVRFCVAHLADAQAVADAALDRAAWSRALAGCWAPNLYLFAGATAPGGRCVARMFAPALGIEEDPATGSAGAALAGVLAERWPEPDGRFEWHIEQGAQIGRPSLIEVAAEKRMGTVVNVQAGGHVVIVAEGVMRMVD